MISRLRHIAWCLALLGLAASTWTARPAQAQHSGQHLDIYDEMKLEERVGETVAKDAVFYNEEGEEVVLADYLDGETPVALSLVYHDCPMLCSLMLDGLTESLRELSWTPGEEFEVLTVSFNAIETPDVAARQKERYLGELGRPEAGAGWHFMTGDEENIQKLTESVGFYFTWMEDEQEYAHPSTLIFLSGEGEIMRYLHGMEYPERYMRNALVEASGGEVGSWIDQAVMYCFQYDPSKNSYVVHAMNVMKIGSLLGAIALGLFLLMFWRREGDQQQRWRGATDMQAAT